MSVLMGLASFILGVWGGPQVESRAPGVLAYLQFVKGCDSPWLTQSFANDFWQEEHLSPLDKKTFGAFALKELNSRGRE